MSMRLTTHLLIACTIGWLCVIVAVSVAVHDGAYPPSTFGLVGLIAFGTITNYVAGERRNHELHRANDKRAEALIATVRNLLVSAPARGMARPPSWAAATVASGHPAVEGTSATAPGEDTGEVFAQIHDIDEAFKRLRRGGHVDG